MNSARLWTLGTVVAVIAILAASVGLGVQPALSAAAAADASRTQIESTNDATQREVARLSRLAATEATLQETDARLQKAVPTALRPNTFIRSLRSIAATDGVTIESIVPSTASSYVVPPGATPAAATTDAGGTAAQASSEPGTATASSPWFGKTDPLITGANFSVVPVTVTATGGAEALAAFASDVQRGERLFAVSTYDSSTSEGVTTATLTGNIYALQR